MLRKCYCSVFFVNKTLFQKNYNTLICYLVRSRLLSAGEKGLEKNVEHGIMKKKYDAIDLLKLVGSILIFSMHIGALRSVGEPLHFYGVQLLARWGVPFFFLASSFFLFSKGTNGTVSREQLKRYTIRILALYALWFVFNIPQILDTWFLSRDLTSVTTWVMIAKEWMISNSFLGSWYLLSCVFSAWIVSMMGRKLTDRTILAITALMYLLCVLTSLYHGLLPKQMTRFLYFTPYNSIICGCFFFAIGKYAAKNRERLSGIPGGLCLLLGLISFALYYVEVILVDKWIGAGATDAAFMLIPASFFLFLFAVNSSVRISTAPWMRRISTIIYCCQGMVIFSATLLCDKLIHTQHTLIITAVAWVLIGAVILAVDLLQKTKLPWTGYLT